MQFDLTSDNFTIYQINVTLQITYLANPRSKSVLKNAVDIFRKVCFVKTLKKTVEIRDLLNSKMVLIKILLDVIRLN